MARKTNNFVAINEFLDNLEGWLDSMRWWDLSYSSPFYELCGIHGKPQSWFVIRQRNNDEAPISRGFIVTELWGNMLVRYLDSYLTIDEFYEFLDREYSIDSGHQAFPHKYYQLGQGW